MCSLCGVLGAEDHWTDGGGRRRALAGGDGQITRRQERQRRVALANAVLSQYRLKLGDWEGQYLVQAPTGRGELVLHLVGIWAAAERLTGRPCDPLDADLIEALERG